MEPALTLNRRPSPPLIAPLIPTAIVAPLDLTTEALHGISARMSWVDMNGNVNNSSEEAMDLSPRSRDYTDTNNPASSESAAAVDTSVPLTGRGDSIIGATFLDQWDVHHEHVRRTIDFWQNFRTEPSQGYQTDSSSERAMSPPTHDYD